jgi:ketosteroid isomerase-like protein
MSGSPFDALEQFYMDYNAAFNAANLATVESHFIFPWLVISAAGVRQVEDGPDRSAHYQSVIDALRAKGWSGSRIDRYEQYRMGEDSALVAVHYSRLRADGSMIDSGRAGYMLRHTDDGWKFTAILDGFGRDGDRP